MNGELMKTKPGVLVNRIRIHCSRTNQRSPRCGMRWISKVVLIALLGAELIARCNESAGGRCVPSGEMALNHETTLTSSTIVIRVPLIAVRGWTYNDFM